MIREAESVMRFSQQAGVPKELVVLSSNSRAED